MLNSRIHDMAKELGKTCIYNFQFAIHVPGRVWGGTAFAKRSEAMKAPVGLLSGSAVCESRWRGLAPTSSSLSYTFLAGFGVGPRLRSAAKQ